MYSFFRVLDFYVLQQIWLCIPFFILLSSLALLPSLWPKFWHYYREHWIIGLTLAFVVPFIWIYQDKGIYEIVHTLLLDYFPFIMTISSLYFLACHMVIKVQASCTPTVNTLFLLLGMIVSSVMGTTGACAVMIRPFLDLNQNRQSRVHQIIFFIFCLANVGGILSSLGDPPLLLGFLKGVPFMWPTIHLWKAWLGVSTLLLLCFWVIDNSFYKKEKLISKMSFSLEIKGKKTIILLLSLVIGVAALSAASWGDLHIPIGEHVLHWPISWMLRDILVVALFLGVVVKGKTSYRKANHFSWGVIRELVFIFLGNFVCVIPVGLLLKKGFSGPLEFIQGWLNPGPFQGFAYFWTTGVLSAFLDNAPAYLLFVESAGGFSKVPELLLKAISCGAVFMGAMTYIGNAPNLLVKEIAEKSGIKMPTFLGYMKWSILILLPTLLLFSYFLIG